MRYVQTGSTTTVMESVSGTSDSDRMFTASGLIPRTSYIHTPLKWQQSAVRVLDWTGGICTRIII